MIRKALRDYLQTVFPSVPFTVDHLPPTTVLCCSLVATTGTYADGKFALDEVGIQFLIRGDNRQQAAQFAEQLYTLLVSAELVLPPYHILSIRFPNAGPVYVGEENGLSYYSLNAVLLTARTGTSAGLRQEV